MDQSTGNDTTSRQEHDTHCTQEIETAIDDGKFTKCR